MKRPLLFLCRGALWLLAVTLLESAAVAEQAQQSPGPSGPSAGEIFGVPVSMGNYNFAKTVARAFPRPWGAADLPEAEQEKVVWESLILHYTAFQRGITVTEEELEAMVNQLLKGHEQTFTRSSDPEAYRRWVKESLGGDAQTLENMVRYILQIRKLKDQIRQEAKVTVTEDEMQQEFFNEKNHVGGEMVVFDTKEEAQVFYSSVKDPRRWERMKKEAKHKVRPVSLMTLEAYMDLWGIPKDQMFAFHAMDLGQVGPPMPFGREWCVYRLLDKRTGDLKDFPKERESYRQQMEGKKKYQALSEAINALKASARLKSFIS